MKLDPVQQRRAIQASRRAAVLAEQLRKIRAYQQSVKQERKV